MTDDFVGTTYPTKARSELRVLPWEGDRRGSHKYYPVVCSVCHTSDPELFPKPLLCKKSDIKKGVVPCGCGSTQWKSWQYKIIIERKHPNITVLGWGEKGFEGLKTKPTIFCKLHKVTTIKHTLHHLMYSEVYPCEECSVIGRREKVCYSKDKAMSELEVHFNKIGGSFIRFEGEYKGLSTMVEWYCSEGHKPKTVLESLIKNYNNCHFCNSNGFRDYLPSYFYLTRFIGEDDESGEQVAHLKYGITNKNPRIRNKRQSSGTIYKTITPISYIYFENGSDARLLEKSLDSLYRTNAVCKEDFPDGYTETIGSDYFDLYDIWGDLISLTGCSVFNGYTQVLTPLGQENLMFKGKYWLLDVKTMGRISEEG